jgi:hypothetical protein
MARRQPEPNQQQNPAGAKSGLDRKVDDEVEGSFPASDPPSYAGGKHRAGAPPKAQSSGRKTKR